MKIFKKAILPRGFKASGVYCGIKKSGLPDLALFYSELPAQAACSFTTNKIQAAPIRVNYNYLENNRGFSAIITNSGNANALTGEEGLKDAYEITEYAAAALGVKNEAVLAASTGIIGRRLPVNKIKQAMPGLVQKLSDKGIEKANKAIMTTDKFAKQITVKFNIGRKTVTICGIAKGAGMVAPELKSAKSGHATMLVFIFTDADITQKGLTRALDLSIDDSFNCITVDGCMSTNDSVMLMANKAAANVPIDLNKNFDLFLTALKTVCLELAKMIVSDGEGATKFIRISVSGSQSRKAAKKIALSIANSNLFKTAMYASSSNVLGRIAASAGAAGVPVKEKDLKIKYSPLNKKNVNIDVSVGAGRSGAVIYTSDLTHEYIKINAEYN